MRALIIIISNVLTLVAALPYLRETISGKARPRLASWFVWTALTGIGAVASYSQHQIPTAIFSAVCSLQCLAIVALGFKYGDRKLETLDVVALGGASAGLIALALLKAPAWAVAITITTDLIGGLPTIKHSWVRPGEETALTYILNALGSGATLLVANFHIFTAFGYPLYLFLFDALVSVSILASPHRSQTAPKLLLAAPTHLTTTSPAQIALLNWEPTPGATSYNIYRNNTKIATTQGLTYIDPSATDGNWRYHVTALNAAGESNPSTVATVLVDHTPPQLTYHLDHQPNEQGWHNRPVTVSFTAGDPKLGIAGCTAPITLDTDGPHQAVLGQATNQAGDSSSLPVIINLDQTPPTLGAPTWSQTQVSRGAIVTLTIPAVDHTSGIAQAEYFFGADPGAGKATPLAITTAAIVIRLQPQTAGVFTINVRAKDVADNWSSAVSASLTVS